MSTLVQPAPQKLKTPTLPKGDDCLVVIFGGTGDLTHRKLIPALYDLATALYRDKKVSDSVYKAARDQFGERGIMDIIGIIGFYDITSMTLITMQGGVPEGKTPPLPELAK